MRARARATRHTSDVGEALRGQLQTMPTLTAAQIENRPALVQAADASKQIDLGRRNVGVFDHIAVGSSTQSFSNRCETLFCYAATRAIAGRRPSLPLPPTLQLTLSTIHQTAFSTYVACTHENTRRSRQNTNKTKIDLSALEKNQCIDGQATHHSR
jgi:hypothetical protein